MTTPKAATTSTSIIKGIVEQFNKLWNDFLEDDEQEQQHLLDTDHDYDDRQQQYKHHQRRPFVIASYAQSIDGFMAPFVTENSKNNYDTNSMDCDNNHKNQRQTKTTAMYPLSSHSSLIMTHAIRSQVDAVVIGSSTLLIDNPRLNNRLWHSDNDETSNELYDTRHQPRPVVLDTNLRYLFESHTELRMTNPIICCSTEAFDRFKQEQKHPRQLCQLDLLPCDVTAEGNLVLLDVLRKLYSMYGIQKVMVEGGAKVLSSFFYNNLVDSICVTIAPKFLHAGIAASVTTIGSTSTSTDNTPSIIGLPPFVDLNLVQPSIFVLESDTILLSRWRAMSSNS
jgi:riboflavin-specific deaminase-like protein